MHGVFHCCFPCCWQVCGEATYVDDMKMHGMLHAALVVSSRPHAKILSVDATAATRVTYIPLHAHLSHCIALCFLYPVPLCCHMQTSQPLPCLFRDAMVCCIML